MISKETLRLIQLCNLAYKLKILPFKLICNNNSPSIIEPKEGNRLNLFMFKLQIICIVASHNLALLCILIYDYVQAEYLQLYERIAAYQICSSILFLILFHTMTFCKYKIFEEAWMAISSASSLTMKLPCGKAATNYSRDLNRLDIRSDDHDIKTMLALVTVIFILFPFFFLGAIMGIIHYEFHVLGVVKRTILSYVGPKNTLGYSVVLFIIGLLASLPVIGHSTILYHGDCVGIVLLCTGCSLLRMAKSDRSVIIPVT